MKSEKLEVVRRSGNVFRDLGFSKEESEHLLVRADLLIQVQKAITSRRLKQAEGPGFTRGDSLCDALGPRARGGSRRPADR